MAPQCSGALSGKFECLRALRGSVGVWNAGEGLPGGLALPGQGSREWGTGGAPKLQGHGLALAPCV